MQWSRIQWDLQHTLGMIGATLLGATLGYMEQQSATNLLVAIQSWAAFKHMLVGAVAFDLSVLLALAKQSFITPPAPPAGNGNADKTKDTLTFPKKPAVMRLATALMIAIALSAVTVTTGCASFLNNPVYVAQQISQYVTGFIQTAQGIWNTIYPLLGANAQADTVLFNDAIVALQTANSLLMDGANAVAAGKGGINLPQLIQAVQDAVGKVMALIQQFQTSAKGSGYAVSDSMTTLARQAATIQHWSQ